ncbi:hypothetical protein RFI_08558 [Reticulomyxa filosa]|uniref:Protein kinase domain-containing protein n=1 Tax=Reticulomyxa filosa TaxID=46433 RepID=X6NTD9_RETFI|nr:hypothetical protein RFI_08558 [Reticulomyxa filosa]|eukprot:ETO28572.1 hypothetical protein RFI_08558 [Reticulomyxa filosa]
MQTSKDALHLYITNIDDNVNHSHAHSHTYDIDNDNIHDHLENEEHYLYFNPTTIDNNNDNYDHEYVATGNDNEEVHIDHHHHHHQQQQNNEDSYEGEEHHPRGTTKRKSTFTWNESLSSHPNPSVTSVVATIRLAKNTLHRLLLMVVHLLRKWTALCSRNFTMFNHNYITLINEIVECLELERHEYLQSIIQDSSLFENVFRSVFKTYINKGDIKDPIVNDFWVQSLTFQSSHINDTPGFLSQSQPQLLQPQPQLQQQQQQQQQHIASIEVQTQTQNQSQNQMQTQQQNVSRYQTDFEELTVLGVGAFGKVTKCRHRLDGRYYAVKRIPIQQRGEELQKVLREVATLSRMQGPYILRYYSAWFESGGADKSVVDLLNFHTQTATIQKKQPTRTALSNPWMNNDDDVDQFEQQSGYFLPNVFGLERVDQLMSLSQSNANTKGQGRPLQGGKAKDDSWFDRNSSQQIHSEPELYLYLVTGYCEQTLRDAMQEQGASFLHIHIICILDFFFFNNNDKKKDIAPIR